MDGWMDGQSMTWLVYRATNWVDDKMWWVVTPLDEIPHNCALGWVRPRQQRPEKERDILCRALQRTRGYPTNIIIPVKHPIKVRLIQFNRDYSLSLDMHVHNFLTVQRMFKMNRWMVVEKEHNNVFTSVRQTVGQHKHPRHKNVCFMETL